MDAAIGTVEDAALPDFEDFYEREHLRLGRAIWLLTGDAGEAEELLQDAFTRVFERWSHVRRMDQPAGYVYRIAANLHRSRWRRALRAIPTLGRESEATPDLSDYVAERVDLWSALATLTPPQREVVVLIEFLGFDGPSAAVILGIRPSSVRVRLHRARARLREVLGGDDD